METSNFTEAIKSVTPDNAKTQDKEIATTQTKFKTTIMISIPNEPVSS